MKTAIVCDWLVALGGAEKFLKVLIECFQEADLFSVVDFFEHDRQDFLQNKEVKTTFIQKLPFAKKHYRSFLPLMPFAIEQLDLSAYDLIISSSHAVAKGVITGPDQVHISYVHSPMRYAWDLQHHYLRESGIDRSIKGLIARYFLHKLRLWDFRSAQGVDHFVSNSHFIAKRIEKTYRRKATVIYPPIDLEKFKPGTYKEDFYIAASRFVPYKKMDLIVESFRHLPNQKLIVIGDGPDFKKVKANLPKNVSLLGFQSTETLIDYLQRAKALIFAAEEDFGLIPLEAQATGTPVIAYGKGGALETVRGLDQENPTGVFFKKQDIESIVKAIAEFENQKQITRENCIAQAALFNKNNFKEKFLHFVNQAVTDAKVYERRLCESI